MFVYDNGLLIEYQSYYNEGPSVCLLYEYGAGMPSRQVEYVGSVDLPTYVSRYSWQGGKLVRETLEYWATAELLHAQIFRYDSDNNIVYVGSKDESGDVYDFVWENGRMVLRRRYRDGELESHYSYEHDGRGRLSGYDFIRRGPGSHRADCQHAGACDNLRDRAFPCWHPVARLQSFPEDFVWN